MKNGYRTPFAENYYKPSGVKMSTPEESSYSDGASDYNSSAIKSSKSNGRKSTSMESNYSIASKKQVKPWGI